MSNIAYICKNRHGMYYARFIIPTKLQSYFNNKKEVRRSLQTDSKRLAIKRARAYRVQFESIVDELMNKLQKGDNKAFEVTLEGETLITLPDGDTKTITGVIRRNLSTFDEDTTKYEEHLLNQIRAEAKLEEERAERANKDKRAEELHQAQLKALTTSAKSEVIPHTANSKLLSEYCKEYIKFQTNSDRKKGTGWGPSTREVKENTLNNFIKSCDKPAAAFNKEDAEQYIKILRATPKLFNNTDHSKKFENGLSIDMLLNDNIDTSKYETLAPSTMGIYISIVSAFFNWIVKYKDIDELQVAIKALKLAKDNMNMGSNRRPFSQQELKTLFEDDNPAKENYVKGFKLKNATKCVVPPHLRYWLPLLALYTGGTIAELCQLHLNDIYKHKALNGLEHWVIDIQEHAEDEQSRLKTDFRPRLIPVHNILLKLGFIDYVKSLKDKGENQLFPTAKRRTIIVKEGVGTRQNKADFSAESRWWGKYSSAAGITDKDVVFHSFRHTVNSFLDSNHIPDELLNAINGHTGSVLGKKVYSKGGHRVKDIGPIVEAINKINYGLKHHPFKQI